MNHLTTRIQEARLALHRVSKNGAQEIKDLRRETTRKSLRFCLNCGSWVSSLAQSGEKVVTPLNGKDLDGWKLRNNSKNKWAVGTAGVDDKGKLTFNKDGKELVNTASDGSDIYTEQVFGDCVVEVEVMVPKKSNSGIYLMGRYEVQILDSFGVKKPGPGDMGGIYSVAAPKVNACKKPGEWQTFVIDFQAPRFAEKKKTSNAIFHKVTLNGEVIHEKVEITKGATGGALGGEVPAGPLMFQGDHGPVAFRNLKITPKK
jgi:hypothetical protein